MTDPNYTAVSLLIDRSGSMGRIAEDANGGIAQFLEDQRALPGRCTVRIAQFDTEYEVVNPSLLVADVDDPILIPRGGTALLDAWGRAMVEFGEELAALPEEERPANVVFVVVTDGHENSSREWTRDRVFEMVTRQTNEWNWQFLYLAANQDAVAVGAQYGVPSHSSVNYAATGEGTRIAYASASAAVTRTRTGKEEE